jgi:hypothetical protein
MRFTVTDSKLALLLAGVFAAAMAPSIAFSEVEVSEIVIPEISVCQDLTMVPEVILEDIESNFTVDTKETIADGGADEDSGEFPVDGPSEEDIAGSENGGETILEDNVEEAVPCIDCNTVKDVPVLEAEGDSEATDDDSVEVGAVEPGDETVQKEFVQLDDETPEVATTSLPPVVSASYSSDDVTLGMNVHDKVAVAAQCADLAQQGKVFSAFYKSFCN